MSSASNVNSFAGTEQTPSSATLASGKIPTGATECHSVLRGKPPLVKLSTESVQAPPAREMRGAQAASCNLLEGI